MNFRTQIEDKSFSFRIKPSDKLFFIGSCFASNIGEKLSSYKFDSEVNPFGAAYNPTSICQLLDRFQKGIPIDEESFVEINHKFYSTMLSTAIFADKRSELKQKIDSIITKAHQKLTESNYLFITLGTSWVYKEKQSSKIVNNCLKLPASRFDRFSLEVEDIVEGFSTLFESNKALKNKQIIFSVSPIRHLKDGLTENTISKSTLILSIQKLMKKYDTICYFPAFEIINDDLRDYRFFDQDMVHPSTVAVDYLFEKFSDWLLEPSCLQFTKECSEITSAMNHRPFDKKSVEHRRFQQKMIQKIEQLEQKYPFVSFNKERAFFNQ